MCTVDGCNNDHLSKGYCSKHYARLRRYGDVNTVKQEKGVYDSCNVNGCENNHFSKGYCSTHYKRWKRNGNPEEIILNRNHNGKCEVEGCKESYYAKGYCVKHYGRWKTHGDPLKVISRKIVGKCKIESCTSDIYCKGYCIRHYQRLIKHGDPFHVEVKTEHDGFCSFEGCEDKYFAKDLCRKHYNQKRKKEYLKSDKGREISRLNCQKRRAMKSKSPINDFSLEQWKECLDFFSYKCAYCGKNTEKLDKEHVIPIFKGGSNSKTNIVPSCGNCNYSKGTKTIFEWYNKQPFYHKEQEIKILKYLGYKVNKEVSQLQLF